MATVGALYPTLADAAKEKNWDGSIARVIEVLTQFNPLISDAPAIEANSGEQHWTTVRTGLPEPTWRKLYQGVFPTKGTTRQVKEGTAMAEDWSEVDAKLVEKQKEPAKYRLNQAKPHIQGMSNGIERKIWYGNTAAEPETFLGLSPRFSSKSAENGGQIIDAGGTGSDNASVWFITWGENATHLIYPEGSQGGLQRDDKGKTTKEVSDGSLYDVYREKFQWDLGLVCQDWRGVSRVANIDVSDLSGASAAAISDFMVDAYYALQNPNPSDGKTIIYANKTILWALHKQATSANNVRLTLENYMGKPVVSFLGHPIHRADALLNTEARVV